MEALGIKGMSKNDIIDKYEINVSNLSETSKGALNDIRRKGEKIVFEERLQQAKEARIFVETITDYYIGRIKAENPTMDYADLLMLGKMFGSHMTSPMRRAANLNFIGLGVNKVSPNKMGSELEYEHMISNSSKTVELIQSKLNDTKLSKDFWKDYTVAIIPTI